MSLADERWRKLREEFRHGLVRAGCRVRTVPDDLLDRGPDVVWPLKPVPNLKRNYPRLGAHSGAESETMVNHPNRGKKERAVLVTTTHRGVFFGYAEETGGAMIKLRGARCCIYWPAENKGFLGLASHGPMNGSKVGPAADIELRDITCVAEVTDAAVLAWETQPWTR